MQTLQAAVLLQEKNTVWTKTAIVRVFNPLAQQHAHMIHSVTTLAANQDIASILRIVIAVLLTQDFQHL